MRIEIKDKIPVNAIKPLVSLLLVSLLINTIKTYAQQNQKPNIVFILADDMGYGDVGSYNLQSKIPTPNMDRLAAEGMRFTDAHSTSSVCTPSRYSILTGRYAWRTELKHGVFFNYEPPLIESSRRTVASLLKNNGYQTAAIGKWHLGLIWKIKKGESFNFNKPLPWPGGTMPIEEESKIDFTKPVSGGPVELGFDYFYGTANCSTCNTPYCYIRNEKVVQQPTEYYYGKYNEQRDGFRPPDFEESTVDSVFTNKAIAFIQRSAKGNQPFFLYLAASSPHEPAEDAVVPEFIRGVSQAGARGDLVALFDWMVGKVTASLEKLGVADNTIIIVTSDNGAKAGNRTRNRRFTSGHQSNGDLRGFKGGIWEGGHRVPLIVKWPGYIKPGSVSHQLIGLQDLMATIADLLNISLPKNAGEDSMSFLPILLDNSNDLLVRKDLIHHSSLGVFAIRKGDWKLIVDCNNSGDFGRGIHGNRGTGPNPEMKGQLYNLSDDPFELFNMIDKNETQKIELLNLLKHYQKAGRSVKR